MSENLELFKKRKPGTQFQCEQTSSNQPSWSMGGSKAEPTTSSRYSSFWGRKRSLDLGRLWRVSRHSWTKIALPLSFEVWLKVKKDISPFTFTPCPSTRISPSKPVFQQTSVYQDQAYLDSHCADIDNKPVYGPSAFGLRKVVWRGSIEAPTNAF